MTYLIAIVVAVLIGAFIALLAFTNIGSEFGEQSGKGEAQRAITTAAEVESSYIAYNAIHGKQIEIADLNDPVELFTELHSTGLLKERVNSDNVEFDFMVQPTNEDDLGNLIIVLDGEDSCKAINLLKAGFEGDVPTCESNPNGLPCCSEGETTVE